MSAAPFYRSQGCQSRQGWLQRRFRRPKPHHEACLDPHWLTLLDAENVQTVILDRREDRNLLQSLRHSSQWSVDFADRQAVILVRRTTASVVELS